MRRPSRFVRLRRRRHAERVDEAIAQLEVKVNEFTLETTRTNQTLIEQQLWTTLMDMCWREPGSRAAYQARIVVLQSRYVALMGNNFPLPACSEL